MPRKRGNGDREAQAVLEPPKKPPENGTTIAAAGLHLPEGSSLPVPARGDLIRPSVTPEQAKAEWDIYVNLCREILDESDYVYFVRLCDREGYEQLVKKGFSKKADAEAYAEKQKRLGARWVEVAARKKRSAFDKLAKFYNLTLPGLPVDVPTSVNQVGDYIIELRRSDGLAFTLYQRADTLEIVKASAVVTVVAPNGKVAVGDGTCSVGERKKGAESFAHPDHDIPATALTRAMNRAISRCIGTGEVSAEEIEAEPSGNGNREVESAPAPSIPATAAAQPAAETAKVTPAQKTGQAETVQPSPAPMVAATSEQKANGFKPLGEAAKLGQRLLHVERFCFGNQANHALRYALLAVGVTKLRPEALERDGHFDPKRWEEAVKALPPEERRTRVEKMESFLAEVGQAQFIQWANALVADWRAKA